MTQTQIISVINQKGGVGKTTTVINLAAGLALQNKKILVVDLDPQGNATTGLGLSNSEDSDKTIYAVLNGTRTLSDVLKKTQFKNLDLISSNVDLSGLEVETAGDSKRAFILKDQIMAYLKDSSSIYDYILIDCPPSLSLLTVMALVASNTLIVPLQTEFFALEGLTQLMKTIDRIKVNLNSNLKIEGRYQVINDNILNNIDFKKIINKCDVIFLDPPYKEKKLPIIIDQISKDKILNDDGIIIIHRHKKEEDQFTKKLEILVEKKYGISKILFCKLN